MSPAFFTVHGTALSPVGAIYRAAIAIIAACGLSPAAGEAIGQGDNPGAAGLPAQHTDTAPTLHYERAALVYEKARAVVTTLPDIARVLPLRMIGASHYRAGRQELGNEIFGEARAAARAIADDYRRDYALRSLAQGEAGAGAIDAAHETAALVVGETSLAEIADTLSDVGDYAGARQLLLRIPPDDTLYHFRLGKLAIAQAESGDAAGAKKAAVRIAEEHTRHRTLAAIGAIHARAGQIEEALALVAEIDSRSGRDSATRDIAEALAAAGYTADALRIARGMNETFVLTRVAEAQIDANDIAGGKGTALEALTMVHEKGEREWNRVVPVVARLAAIGEVEAAREIIDKVKSREVIDECRRRLVLPEARRIAASGDWQAALARLDELEDDARESAKLNIVEQLVDLNDLTGAVSMIGAMKKSGPTIFRDSAFRLLAAAQADAGEWDAATKSIGKIDGAQSRQLASRLLLREQLKENALDEALKTARNVPTYEEIRKEPGWRPSVVREFTVDVALRRVASARLSQGDFAEARAISEEIGDKDLKQLLLREIAASEATAALPPADDAASTRAASVDDPSARNRALEIVAVRKASSGDLEGALEIIGQIDDSGAERIHAYDRSMTRAGAAGRVARQLIGSGHFEQGERFLVLALDFVRTIENPGQAQSALLEILNVLE